VVSERDDFSLAGTALLVAVGAVFLALVVISTPSGREEALAARVAALERESVARAVLDRQALESGPGAKPDRTEGK